MARLVILGAGVAGHTAASFGRKWLGKEHEVVVVSPNTSYNWVPSNIWVGVGKMAPEKVLTALRPIYDRSGVEFRQAKATALHPEGDAIEGRPHVDIEYTEPGKAGVKERIPYDFLINATGPKLNFGATEGLGPDKNSWSVCTAGHAKQAADALAESIERMRRGERQRFLIGTGHGMCTCQGAAIEYLFNLEHVLCQAGVRDHAEIHWLSNEYELGDFGMGGIHIRRGGYISHSKSFTESMMAERGIHWHLRAHTKAVEPGVAHYETLEGTEHELPFDFAMLIPPFAGVGLQAFDHKGEEITKGLFNPGGFMLVDGDYTARPYEQWSPKDWPKTYQSPLYPNIYAAGIAFAPPHPISKPMKTPGGTLIVPTPPRTGMPSAMIGKAVTASIVDSIKHGVTEATHTASMADMGAACVASSGCGWRCGSAVAMAVYPLIPDFERYPRFGRDTDLTFAEIGLAGHWLKYFLHLMFLYKVRQKVGWRLIPE
jgi:sulfide:quinone oxidoreductase